MMMSFHLLRPWWLAALIPTALIFIQLLKNNPELTSWSKICDSHLLSHLMKSSPAAKRHYALGCLFFSALFIIISLAGPAWFKNPVPAYQPIQPRVVVLDMSNAMLADDIPPTRLKRAKFKLHDLFSQRQSGQFGLVVFTGEPFIVSPLTNDAKTIDALLSSLTPDVMPVGGNRLDLAIKEGASLIEKAGYKQGQLLVLTAESPNIAAIREAGRLAKAGIVTSVMPITPQKNLNLLFAKLASTGNGVVLPLTGSKNDLKAWVDSAATRQYHLDKMDNVPVWRDEGRWFLIPALLFLLPVFRRGWIQRIAL